MDRKCSRSIWIITVLVLTFSPGFICNIQAKEPTGKESEAISDKSAAFTWRIVGTWISRTKKRTTTLFTRDELLNITPSSPTGRFIADMRDCGFNAITIGGPSEAKGKLASYLKKQGMGSFIVRRWSETVDPSYPKERTGQIMLSTPSLSPYDEKVRAYWAERIKQDHEMVPDLTGYKVQGREFYFGFGAPWMGAGPIDETKTGRERARDAIILIADLLAEYGGTLIWDIGCDDPWGQRHEVHYYRALTGEIPENAFIEMKQHYWDHHPGWPRHPLYDYVKKDDQGKTPYMSRLQHPGEYRGVHDFPWSMVDEWSGIFRDMADTGYQGFSMGAITHPDGRENHLLLNQVNWYAIKQYIHDPYAEPSMIKLEWAREEFGADAAPVVVNVIDRVTEAARGMYEFDCLWTGNHSRFPTLEYLDSHLCGPYRDIDRMTKMMGYPLPLDMYPPERACEIRKNPKTHMLFNQEPITPKLKAEAMAQKDGATRYMEEAIALWKSLEGKIEEGKYKKVLAGLEGNRDDTVIFSHMMDLYMDWKLGVLTEAKIDAVLHASKGLKGIVVPAPLDENPEMPLMWGGEGVGAESLKTFAEKLREDLRNPWVELFFRENPSGVAAKPGKTPTRKKGK